METYHGVHILASYLLKSVSAFFPFFLYILSRAELKRSLLQQNIQKIEEVGHDHDCYRSKTIA